MLFGAQKNVFCAKKRIYLDKYLLKTINIHSFAAQI